MRENKRMRCQVDVYIQSYESKNIQSWVRGISGGQGEGEERGSREIHQRATQKEADGRFCNRLEFSSCQLALLSPDFRLN